MSKKSRIPERGMFFTFAATSFSGSKDGDTFNYDSPSGTRMHVLIVRPLRGRAVCDFTNPGFTPGLFTLQPCGLRANVDAPKAVTLMAQPRDRSESVAADQDRRSASHSHRR